MSYDQLNCRVSAPCIIDTGIVVNKRDMQKLLVDLGRVRYIHIQDSQVKSQGEGHILEVFADQQQATLIANHALYLNVYSFDYLELKQSSDNETYFDLVQDGRLLRLVPLSNPLQDQATRNLQAAAFDAVMDQVLSNNWDTPIDDDDCPF
ncbi:MULTISPECIES: hypothetical protein [Arthrospira]|jgi:hypothetical protein|uniref:Uncharacterized protein n=1 Tax=Limnospira platensis NIES-46 TaxID=1236695 RepID=A0A5M3T8U9_LIMPL|nr:MULTISPECIES: hypothetical protein [Arthrospira]AMW31316.1 hypothetical protein AP285_28735 [Arthrospira platensis YZ]KDR56102.1 hypothetical protein APPUASWS_019070 [Arthrospira platensis str. Paraca]MBD2667886.1 hypothetical protein [Arthrospira platensis FACHB-439]MBD2708976.1 hypothetical protein [Arthrospira platensis FACHB-835]MDF2208783.1 hypothetical protein [Arthrospira platensis NCB002]MDT9181296.1 hypothetical protein [Limnospira sp. PMC 289.06]MDT9293809.1 hypothetical protein